MKLINAIGLIVVLGILALMFVGCDDGIKIFNEEHETTVINYIRQKGVLYADQDGDGIFESLLTEAELEYHADDVEYRFVGDVGRE